MPNSTKLLAAIVGILAVATVAAYGTAMERENKVASIKSERQAKLEYIDSRMAELDRKLGRIISGR